MSNKNFTRPEFNKIKETGCKITKISDVPLIKQNILDSETPMYRLKTLMENIDYVDWTEVYTNNKFDLYFLEETFRGFETIRVPVNNVSIAYNIISQDIVSPSILFFNIYKLSNKSQIFDLISHLLRYINYANYSENEILNIVENLTSYLYYFIDSSLNNQIYENTINMTVKRCINISNSLYDMLSNLFSLSNIEYFTEAKILDIIRTFKEKCIESNKLIIYINTINHFNVDGSTLLIKKILDDGFEVL